MNSGRFPLPPFPKFNAFLRKKEKDRENYSRPKIIQLDPWLAPPLDDMHMVSYGNYCMLFHPKVDMKLT